MKYVSPNQNKAGAVSISSSVLSEFFQHEYNMALRQYTALEQGPVLNVTNEPLATEQESSRQSTSLRTV